MLSCRLYVSDLMAITQDTRVTVGSKKVHRSKVGYKAICGFLNQLSNGYECVGKLTVQWIQVQ